MVRKRCGLMVSSGRVGDAWTNADWFQGQLEADGKRNFNLERQTLGAAKHLSITSSTMDLEWLPDSEQFVWRGQSPMQAPTSQPW